MRWDSTFYVVNNVAQIVFAIAIMVFPIFVLTFYCRNFARWSDESFEEKYGAIFEGLKTNSRASLAYPIVFVLRRIVLVFTAVVTDNLFFVQLASMVLISFGQISYLIYYKPFTEPLLLKLDIFNEVTTIILVEILTCFSQANTKPLDFEMDIFFLVGLFGNITVHLYFLVKNSLYSVKLSCKKKCLRRKQKLAAAKYQAPVPTAGLNQRSIL